MKKICKHGLIYIVLTILFIACSPTSYPVEHGAVTPISVDTETLDTESNIQADEIAGTVLNENNIPLPGTVIRLQATGISTTTNGEGKFVLQDLPINTELRITAYKSGYFIKEADVTGGIGDVIIKLHTHNTTDNQSYQWLSAGISKSPTGDGSVCADCHAREGGGVMLPVDEWLQDAHAASGQNPRFFSMYNGTDLSGQQSPLTTYVDNRDYGRTPIRPKYNETYFGPGFLLDFPDSTGSCAACHLPLAAIDQPYEVNPNLVSGTARQEGINCDFCHKIWDVQLDPASGTPYANMPGVVSFAFLRPPDGHQLFIGPFDDVAPGEDTFSPLQNESQFCAPCHFGDFWGVRIYNSFGEWLESDYADPESDTFKTCQDCHMPPLGVDHFARIDKGALRRDSTAIFSHRMPGAADQQLLENTAELAADIEAEGEKLIVNVTVTNSEAGHHIPTDSPLRQIFLVVTAKTSQGKSLSLSQGETLPIWAGDLANHPGKYYAKILEELWTEVSPTGSYWAQTRLVEDTRLPALETDSSDYIFELDGADAVIVEVSLIFRRAFYDLMEWKGWDTPDILMEQIIVDIDTR